MLSFRYRCFILLLCCIAATNVLHGQWKSLATPSKALVRDVEVISDSVFLATATTGIFRTTNSGMRWHIAREGYAGVLGRVGNTFLAGRGNEGIFASRDSGITWVPTEPDLPARYPIFFTTMGSRIFAGFSDEGLFFSDDEGATWTQTAAEFIPKGPSAGVVMGNIIVVAYDNAVLDRTLFMSADSGATWMPIGPPRFQGYSLLAAGSQLFAGGNGVIFRSDDSGKSWTEFRTGFPHNEIEAMVWNGSCLLASSRFRDMLRSTDNGTIWTPIEQITRNLTSVYSMKANGSQIIAATDKGVHISDDNGTTWTRYNAGITENSPKDYVNRLFIHDTTMYAIEEFEAAIYYSTDRGTTWLKRGPTPYAPEQMLDVVNVGSRFIIGAYSKILLSDDSAATVFEPTQQPTLSLTSRMPQNTLVSDGKTLFVGTRDLSLKRGRVFYSKDTGMTWNPVDVRIDSNGVNAICVHKGKVFAGSNYGLFASADGGESWERITANVPGGMAALEMAASDSAIFLYKPLDKILVSEDAGETWVVRSPGQYVSIRGMYATNTYLFVWDSDTLRMSTDRGATWRTISDGLVDRDGRTIGVRALLIFDEYLYAGTNGFGIWRRPLSDFIPATVEDSALARPAPYTLSPHPLVSFSTLYLCRTCKMHNATLVLSTLEGRQVYTVGHLYGPAVHIDRGTIAAGVYVFTLSEDGRVIASGTIAVE